MKTINVPLAGNGLEAHKISHEYILTKKVWLTMTSVIINPNCNLYVTNIHVCASCLSKQNV